MSALYAWFADLAGRGLLPSDFQYPFLIRGILSVLVLAPVLGGLSHLVVTRRMAFFSAALGQAALTGVALGLLLDRTEGRGLARIGTDLDWMEYTPTVQERLERAQGTQKKEGKEAKFSWEKQEKKPFLTIKKEEKKKFKY